MYIFTNLRFSLNFATVIASLSLDPCCLGLLEEDIFQLFWDEYAPFLPFVNVITTPGWFV